jgi:uncharacterized protein YdaU (DUF1376 family)
MNFFSFHIGDYMTKTRHLSWEEDMAYRRLLDVYYGTEKPLPADKRAVYRLVLAQTAKHRQAIDVVLSEFFTLTAAGYENARCNAEIDAAALKREKAAQSARRRWESDPAKPTHSEGNANASADAMRTHSEGNAPNPNPNPIPNKERESARTPKLLEPREATEQTHKDIARDLLQSPTAKLSDWERQFLGSIAESRSLTRHQRERFDAIVGAQQHRPSGEGSTISIDDMRKLGVRI